jgi:hypothetical protein
MRDSPLSQKFVGCFAPKIRLLLQKRIKVNQLHDQRCSGSLTDLRWKAEAERRDPRRGGPAGPSRTPITQEGGETMLRSKLAITMLLGLAWPASAQSVPDFRIAIQVSDHGTSGAEAGEPKYSGYASDRSVWSDWASDINRYDPDAICVTVEADTHPSAVVLNDTDVRLAIQLTDNDRKQTGAVQYTSWASEGGGWSGWALDSNGHDPDEVRVMIETRPKKGLVIRDLRVGIQLSDHKGKGEIGLACYSGWLLRGGGGWSDRASDSSNHDPDAVRIKLEVRVASTP